MGLVVLEISSLPRPSKTQGVPPILNHGLALTSRDGDFRSITGRSKIGTLTAPRYKSYGVRAMPVNRKNLPPKNLDDLVDELTSGRRGPERRNNTTSLVFLSELCDGQEGEFFAL